VKNRKQSLRPPGQYNQLLRFLSCSGERFIDDHVFTGTQSALSKLKVSVIGRGDDHQVNVGIRKYLVCIRGDPDSRQICRFGLAGENLGNTQAGDMAEQRKVKNSSR